MVDLKSILAQIANGNSANFDKLYEELTPLIYSTILSHTHNVQAAEEITQDVFVKVFRSADTFHGASKVSTWAYWMT